MLLTNPLLSYIPLFESFSMNINKLELFGALKIVVAQWLFVQISMINRLQASESNYSVLSTEPMYNIN